jgi:cysteinyl-tRNA synthetase
VGTLFDSERQHQLESVMSEEDFRKQLDKLRYEMAGAVDDARTYKMIADNQKEIIKYLTTVLNEIRKAHRAEKQYEVSDLLRTILNNVGYEVRD